MEIMSRVFLREKKCKWSREPATTAARILMSTNPQNDIFATTLLSENSDIVSQSESLFNFLLHVNQWIHYLSTTQLTLQRMKIDEVFLHQLNFLSNVLSPSRVDKSPNVTILSLTGLYFDNEVVFWSLGGNRALIFEIQIFLIQINYVNDCSENCEGGEIWNGNAILVSTPFKISSLILVEYKNIKFIQNLWCVIDKLLSRTAK